MIIRKMKEHLKLMTTENHKYECIKICIIYLIIGFIWVCFSDRAAHALISDESMLLLMSTSKGILYVIITSIILYFLIDKLLKKVAFTEDKLKTQYKKVLESENRLIKSEEKNMAIIKAMPDLLFIIDDGGRFVDCIANDESYLLMCKEAFIGKRLCEVMSEEISKAACEKIKLVLQKGTLETFEYKLIISNEEQYFELRMVKYTENQILAIARNITDQRENELQLKINEEKYKVLISEMQQGLVLFQGVPDEKGEIANLKFIDSNESYEKLMGLSIKEMMGKTVKEIFPDLDEAIIKKIKDVVKTGISERYERYRKEVEKYYEVIAYRPKEFQFAAIVTDITERKLAVEALKVSEYNFRNIFETSSDAILIIQDDKIIDCNQALVEILGYNSKAYIVGKSPFDFYPEKQPDGQSSEKKALEMRERTMKNGKCVFEWWYKRTDGSLMPVEVMLTTIMHNGKKTFHSLWRDISERKKMEEKLEYLSYHDQMTGLYNRRFFEEKIERLENEKCLPLAVIMADVNGLKLVNDSFGHAIGDALIKKVAEVISKGCKAEDIICRIGGDEFVILLPQTGSHATQQIIKNIKVLASKERIGAVSISISFGYEIKKSEKEKFEEILKKAEDYMYKKKLFEGPSMRGKTISAIIGALHEKNKREEQHSQRVSELCECMGRVLHLSEDKLNELKTVGLLHDIGKIAIDENILNKPGKLTGEEWEQIKRHPEIGYRILNTVNYMSEMSQYVLAHHEMWNGKGYPKGLKEEEIPLQSRIIAIADSYDAMISERSYRCALKEEVAVEELKRNAGLQFDPELVGIFIGKVLNNGL